MQPGMLWYVSYCHPCDVPTSILRGAYVDGPQSSSGLGELAIARRPLAHPPVAGRKRNSSSFETTPRRSQRPRLSCSAQRSAIAEPRMPRNTFGVDVAEIFERSTLSALELTRAEVANAQETPGIERSLFNSVFGGRHNAEWRRCAKIPGYEDFLCAVITAQPFMPLGPGKPGLLLRLPTVFETPQGDQSTSFNVFSSTLHGGALYYRGNYTKVPIPHVPIEWSRLPYSVCMNVEAFPTHQGHISNVI